ncbi:MAG: SHOCT domain-containing protein [Gaiellaceae bacterium]
MLRPPGRQSGRRKDVDDQLRKLSELHRDGVLTDAEFEAKKAELHARS